MFVVKHPRSEAVSYAVLFETRSVIRINNQMMFDKVMMTECLIMEQHPVNGNGDMKRYLVASGNAFCSPYDQYDFLVGAKTALENATTAYFAREEKDLRRAFHEAFAIAAAHMHSQRAEIALRLALAGEDAPAEQVSATV